MKPRYKYLEFVRDEPFLPAWEVAHFWRCRFGYVALKRQNGYFIVTVISS